MLLKTHLALGLAGVLFFLPSVVHKLAFFIMVMFATFLPDIDCVRSIPGNHWFLRPLQWTTKHRGLLHSFTFCLLISILLAIFIPILSLPFFLGYSIHLFADGFTQEGIRPFWPFKDEVKGRIHVGGNVERGLFYGIILMNIILIVRLFI